MSMQPETPAGPSLDASSSQRQGRSPVQPAIEKRHERSSPAPQSASRRRVVSGVAAAAGAFAAAPLLSSLLADPVRAQTAGNAATDSAARPGPAGYPDRPVRLVVGFAPGGATDIVTRLVAQKLAEIGAGTFLVENRPGAGSNIAAEAVAKAPADGYTILLGTNANTANMSLYERPGYSVANDLDPMVWICSLYNVLVVHPSVPARNVSELIALAKAQPGTLNFASSGSGTSIHLSGELFRMMAGVNIVHVPYKGSAPAVTDLIGGQVQMMFDNAPSAMPHILSGKLRALGVTSAQRLPSLPEIPTVAESGVPGFEVMPWFGFYAPRGTPPAVISRFNQLVNEVLKRPEVRQRLAELGAEAKGGSPAALGEHTRNEIERWSKVVAASGAKVQ